MDENDGKESDSMFFNFSLSLYTYIYVCELI